jgi:hypothetical protein
MTRTNAPHRLSADVAGMLETLQLTLGSLLTTTSAKAVHTAAGGTYNAIHYALPQRQLARAIDPRTVASIAPRGYLPELAALAERTGTAELARRHNGCKHSTPGCVAGCLASAGHGGLSTDVAACRGRRTLAMVSDPATYTRAMVYAIARELARAERLGMPCAVRLCGTDETFWPGRVAPITPADAVAIRRRFGVDVETGDALNVAETFAPMRARGALLFYEYLKAGVHAPTSPLAWLAAGWQDVTASFAADRSTACRDAIAAVRAGLRVAFPVRLARNAAPLRSVTIETYGDAVTLPAVDGDATGDARWNDPAGSAVVLREKRARGADRTIAERFTIADAPTVELADGRLILTR